MSLYTERHGMRTAIEKTTVVNCDMYALLFDCCEKYFDNIAWKYPRKCPDGNGCCGLDVSKLINDLKFTIPNLYGVNSYTTFGWLSKPSDLFSSEDEYDQFALFDFIEFVSATCKDISHKVWHDYYNHFDLEHSTSNYVMKFREDINEVFEKTGLLYRLEFGGHIERVEENSVLNKEIEYSISSINEPGIQELLNSAIKLHKSPYPSDHKEAVEKIWDAFERLKSYYATSQKDKASSIDKILSDMSGGEEYFKQLFDAEFKALTNDIGNACYIRHSEVWQVDITDMRHYDYFFNRCLSLIALAIQYLKP